MNLRKLTGCIILIWLPLASSTLRDNEGLSGRPSPRPMEEDSVKAGPRKATRRMFPESFPKVNSANKQDAGDASSGSGVASAGEEKSAHGLAGGSPRGRDPSALDVNTSVASKSAAVVEKRRRKLAGRKIRTRRDTVMRVSLDDDPNAFEEYDEEMEEVQEKNATEMGSYLGAPCELTCSEKLLHVFCDPTNRVCECEDKYPVQIGVGTGCEKPKQLGDQCFYAQTCSFFDPNAVCTQINHNAICQCKPGFHTVALRKGVKRMFCSEDIDVVSADLPTLLGVATGIAVLTGLICFVLRLFSGSRYPNARHYATANVAPPLLLPSDNQWINGIPLTVHGRPPSRASCQRSTTSLAQYSRSKGVLVPASRAGSRRHSFSSVQSTTSSQKSMSYSARRFEQENQQKEQRAAMRVAREEAARLATPLTPSPMSTDGLIPPPGHAEEEPLCFAEEPPAVAIAKGNVPVEPTSPK